jgi:site-specific recombinase XerD
MRVIETAAEAAQISGIGAHNLRHSAAVDWLESGVHNQTPHPWLRR